MLRHAERAAAPPVVQAGSVRRRRSRPPRRVDATEVRYPNVQHPGRLRRQFPRRDGGPYRGRHRGQTPPTCPSCGTSHLGRCEDGTLMCYKCGKAGHVTRHCQERPDGGQPSKGNSHQQGRATGANQDPPICPLCAISHYGRCIDGTLICFNCGKPGHMSRNCYERPGRNEPANKQQRTGGRIFSLEENEAEAGPSTAVTGQTLITDTPLHVLIDSGATNS